MSDWKQRMQFALRDKTNRALARHPLVLRQEDLQLAVERRFPLTFEQIVPITLHNPYIRLHQGSDQLGLEIDVSADIANTNRFTSRWLLTGQLVYRRERGEFYLHQPDIRSLDPGSIFETINAPSLMRGLVIEELLTSLAASTPLYRLHNSNPRHALIRQWLHSISVEDGKLLIQLAVDHQSAGTEQRPPNQS